MTHLRKIAHDVGIDASGSLAVLLERLVRNLLGHISDKDLYAIFGIRAAFDHDDKTY